MSALEASPASRDRTGADILTLAFGTAVVMWVVGYFGRLPSIMAPSVLLFVLFLVCLLGGGFLAGRLTGRGWFGGVYVGALCGVINLMILLSLLSGDLPNEIAPAAIIWIPGFVVASAILGGVGAVAGGRGETTTVETDTWPSVFVFVTVIATFLLMAVGGLVTSNDAGLAVVDWPNSYGYNMFLFPLSRMTGGIYYEHAHRLFGALVGLTTVVLAFVIQRHDDRAWVKKIAWLAVAMVVVQGILGGLRVTGHPTLSTSPDEVSPNIFLAVVHGVLGQLFLATVVSLAVFTSKTWRKTDVSGLRTEPRTDPGLTTALLAALVVQLVLGAVQRHLASGLVIHISMAVIVACLAAAAGVRAWALNPEIPVVRQLGKWLLALLGVQLLLGLGAFVATGVEMGGAEFSVFAVTITTAHQWCGALLLAWAVALMLWSRRLAAQDRGR